jgi:hypothetical protein
MNEQITLTQRQKIFTKEYLDTGNATEAASRAYKPKNRNTAHSMGAENLRKPAIRAFLEANAINATATICKLSKNAKSEGVRLSASKDILDRAGYSSLLAKNDEDKKILVVPSDIAALCGFENGTVFTVLTVFKEFISRDKIPTLFDKLMIRPNLEELKEAPLALKNGSQ